MIYFIYLFLLLSHQLLAPVAGKKNKFISFRERSSDNHIQFQTKMFKSCTRFQTKTAQNHTLCSLLRRRSYRFVTQSFLTNP